jgi:hypothetical protein
LRPWRRQLHSWQAPRRRSSTESTDWRCAVLIPPK